MAMCATVVVMAAGTLPAGLCDSTLRIDYVLSGSQDPADVRISFARLCAYDGWHGRTTSLDSLVLPAAADITLMSAITGDTLYRMPFSTLFQEWLASDDCSGPRAMEGSALVPMPRMPVRVVINLRDRYHKVIAHAARDIDPSDILIRHCPGGTLPAKPIFTGSAPSVNKIRVAIIAEGYAAEDMDQFHDYATRASSAILGTEPFTSAAQYFDFVAIETPSRQSGVSVPANGNWLDTAFGSHFSTFYSDRYLTVPAVWRVYDAMADAGCHHAIILANTDEYGGGGIFNLYTVTAAGHRLFENVVVHEFGHSFAGLADEYYYDDDDYAVDTYPDGVEPWERNITTQINFTGKWETLDEPRLIEGGGYRSHGVWRSAPDCRMHSNDTLHFCPACTLAISRMIGFYTNF